MICINCGDNNYKLANAYQNWDIRDLEIPNKMRRESLIIYTFKKNY